MSGSQRAPRSHGATDSEEIMSNDDPIRKAPSALTRRSVLHGIGAALSAVPLGALAGCGDTSATTGAGGSAGTDSAGGAGNAGGTSGTGGAGGSTSTSTSTSTAGFASGGTASMSGDYPDPFTDDLGTTCPLICMLTLGPCYAQTIERKDISEGYPGLPVRLAFLVVDETCSPVGGASVDIWHTRNAGLYSGPDAIDFCTTGDPDAKTHQYFRGVQTADASGRVDFDTCYPGWYPGRAIHIHFTVRVNGQEYVTSQVFFPDDLTAEVFAVHPEYKEFGPPNTMNTTDGIYGGEEFLVSTKLQPDGALLAWKVLVIRSSLADPICAG
jgi:protocatechuate 3,4-dioxygenase beta subunit